MLNDDLVQVTWFEDSSGVRSCHLNDGKLLKKDSYLGHLTYDAAGWHVKLKGVDELLGPFESLKRATVGLLTAVSGKGFDVWS